ncbi:hypothetical protein O6H91_05G115600 [Diphasiastrum complanatum]|nr:hypothetical protein O6H91_05G115600 [Diphasiastrum complanatum]
MSTSRILRRTNRAAGLTSGSHIAMLTKTGKILQKKALWAQRRLVFHRLPKGPTPRAAPNTP